MVTFEPPVNVLSNFEVRHAHQGHSFVDDMLPIYANIPFSVLEERDGAIGRAGGASQGRCTHRGPASTPLEGWPSDAAQVTCIHAISPVHLGVALPYLQSEPQKRSIGWYNPGANTLGLFSQSRNEVTVNCSHTGMKKLLS